MRHGLLWIKSCLFASKIMDKRYRIQEYWKISLENIPLFVFSLKSLRLLFLTHPSPLLHRSHSNISVRFIMLCCHGRITIVPSPSHACWSYLVISVFKVYSSSTSLKIKLPKDKQMEKRWEIIGEKKSDKPWSIRHYFQNTWDYRKYSHWKNYLSNFAHMSNQTQAQIKICFFLYYKVNFDAFKMCLCAYCIIVSHCVPSLTDTFVWSLQDKWKRLRGVHLETLKQELLKLCLGTLSALLTFSSNLLFPDDFFPFSLCADYCKYVFLSTVKSVNHHGDIFIK